ncbi:hypothetical protein [Xanthocytophaga flava]|uniref:hypothetical protein n=1 Tax=Xanthocytophaga flava TaxID=3048013 RepID=UPI0028D8270F|nr:hypothetical protein [Xanthocytophaga flavus]MDJ1470738.1 hypothetical protein [Xanthocytophaga flavus]
MKLVYWFFLLFPLMASAQIGVFNLDSLVEKHPFRWEIERRALLKSQSFTDSAEVWKGKFMDLMEWLDNSICACCGSEEATKAMSEKANNLYDHMLHYQDSVLYAIPAFRKRNIDQLRVAIGLDCYSFANYLNLSFLFHQKGVLYSSPEVKDYTAELVSFLHDKYQYTLVKGRLQRKGSP